mmetsp:Transcript_6852/g.23957  ORF Transcript_6852/g.23957 Transcript_6852/m.23957 type:complete len:453 (+) Transcript_6852:936-2294(+)
MLATVSEVVCALLLAPASYHIGELFQKIKLPLITGYLCTGILCGPNGLGLLTRSAAEGLWVIDDACLAAIALAAGSELQWAEIKKTKTPILALTFCITIFTWVFVYSATMAASPFIVFTDSFTYPRLVAISSLAGTLMVARSPASALAILRETGGKGDFCSLALSVIVVKDVVVVVLFALNLELARMLFLPDAANGGMDFTRVLEPFGHLALSGCLGVFTAILIGGLILRPQPRVSKAMARFHPSLGTLARFGPAMRPPLLVAVGFVLYGLCRSLHAEPLLACLVCGAVAANRLHDRGDREREELHEAVGSVMPWVNLAFFSLAGASLKVDGFVSTAGVAILIFLCRLLSLYCGCWLGSWIAGSPPEHRKVAWMAYVTQAGVAMGLTRTVVLRFPDWGGDFASLMVSIIVMNQLIGPPLFKAAIAFVGEGRKQREPKPAPVHHEPKTPGAEA